MSSDTRKGELNFEGTNVEKETLSSLAFPQQMGPNGFSQMGLAQHFFDNEFSSQFYDKIGDVK